jgi:hypothetical protein
MVERLIDPARHHEHAGRAQRLPEHPMSSFARGMPEYSVTNAPTDFSQAKSMTDSTAEAQGNPAAMVASELGIHRQKAIAECRLCLS